MNMQIFESLGILYCNGNLMQLQTATIWSLSVTMLYSLVSCPAHSMLAKSHCFAKVVMISADCDQWPVLVILRKTKLTSTAVIIIHSSGLTYIQPQTACSSPQPPASAPSSSSTSHISRTKNVETQKAKHGLETWDWVRCNIRQSSRWFCSSVFIIKVTI